MSMTTSITEGFKKKKASILAALSIPLDAYTDKSPKGSVDAPIIDLIDEINAIDGLVTTSSCSGRVSVFVEGPKRTTDANNTETLLDSNTTEAQQINDNEIADVTVARAISSGLSSAKDKKLKTGPGGKGGGRWLYVSHESVDLSQSKESASQADTTANEEYFTRLCRLERSANLSTARSSGERPLRLIRLSFSPLILHVLTSDLSRHTRPLLSAAINAGFRESGVQSLAALEVGPSSQATTTNTGTMIGIRTAGLAFETIIGRVGIEKGDAGEEREIMEALVNEDYLRMCFDVINERFAWNEERKERLRAEIQLAFEREARKGKNKDGESKEERRRRKREEGLERKRLYMQQATMTTTAKGAAHGDDGETDSRSDEDIVIAETDLAEQLDDGLGLDVKPS